MWRIRVRTFENIRIRDAINKQKETRRVSRSSASYVTHFFTHGVIEGAEPFSRAAYYVLSFLCRSFVYSADSITDDRWNTTRRRPPSSSLATRSCLARDPESDRDGKMKGPLSPPPTSQLWTSFSRCPPWNPETEIAMSIWNCDRSVRVMRYKFHLSRLARSYLIGNKSRDVLNLAG